MGLPRRPDEGVILEKYSRITKYQIAPCKDILQLVRQCGMFPGFCRVPVVEEGQHRPSRRAVYIV